MGLQLTPLADGLSAYAAEWAKYGQVLDEIETALGALPSATLWPIESNSGDVLGVVNLQDYFRKFTNFSWTLTDKSYSELNGGVGAVVSLVDKHRNWLSAAEEINATNFGIYMSHPEYRGAVYLALHEVAHTTELGLRTNRFANDHFDQRHGDRTEWSKSDEWYYNERVANRIALKVAKTIDLPILEAPCGGYQFDVISRLTAIV